MVNCKKCSKRVHRDNLLQLCGVCGVAERAKAWRDRNPHAAKASVARFKERHPDYRKDIARRPRQRFLISRHRAGVKWGLTFQDWSGLASKPCHYCHTLPNDLTTGCWLDRIDNGSGYTLDNVLPCCGGCNRTRGDRFTVSEMEVMIRAVSVFRRSK